MMHGAGSRRRGSAPLPFSNHRDSREDDVVSSLQATAARLLLLALALLLPFDAGAEATAIKIGRAYSLGQLPTFVMDTHKLVEKHASAQGLHDLKVEWVSFAGAGPENDALLSGDVAFTLNGPPASLMLWDKTRGRENVHIVAAVDNELLFLNTRNPAVKSIQDFSDKDKIAVPSVGISVAAIQLQLAAQKAFGEAGLHRLDRFTMSLSSPDALVAMLSGSDLNANFASEPYSTKELEQPGVHTVLTTRDILGGPATQNVFVTTEKFRRENPKIYRAFVDALKEADEIIERDKRAAANLFMTRAKGFTFDEIHAPLEKDSIQFSMAPSGLMRYAEFLYKAGRIKTMPTSWRDCFFPDPEIDKLSGS
jgi:NitT/TauT family transport system substrate-binding protein